MSILRGRAEAVCDYLGAIPTQGNAAALMMRVCSLLDSIEPAVMEAEKAFAASPAEVPAEVPADSAPAPDVLPPIA